MSTETTPQEGPPPQEGATAADAPARSFEHALSELEDRVRRLDSGELPLEEALQVFEQGVRLQQECQDLLDTAERRVVELSATPDGVGERPFDPSPADG
jgi:exodeoxyribonuclease VII small subunit